MSRKLATTIKDSAIPGKYKRVLEAYAAFANNDGTNIRPAKEQLGKKAGVSADTIYRITPELIESSILRKAQSHTCKVSNCNKGGTHFTGTWGRYTVVYEIQIDNLQNAERYLLAKYLKVNAAKCRKVLAANCDTTQALKNNSAALGTKPDSSALTSGSEVVSEGADDSLRSSSRHSTSQTHKPQPVQTTGSVANQSQKQNQPQEDVLIHWNCSTLSGIWLKRTGRAFTAAENILATDLIAQHGYDIVEAVLDITLNKREKSAKMVWKRFKVFADNWQTNYDLSMAWVALKKSKNERPREIPAKFNLSLMKADEEKSCREYFAEQCKVGEWALSAEEWKATEASDKHFAAALRFCCENVRRVNKAEFVDLIREAMTGLAPEPAGVSFTDLCPDCGWEHADCTCPGKAKAVAAGKGFDPEEAE
jgi:hypothetical protein